MFCSSPVISLTRSISSSSFNVATGQESIAILCAFGIFSPISSVGSYLNFESSYLKESFSDKLAHNPQLIQEIIEPSGF